MRLVLGVLFLLCSLLICLGSYAEFSQPQSAEQETVQVTESPTAVPVAAPASELGH